MSRIRTIKPEAFTDEGLWDAEQETGLPLFRAFTGLWCQADREGRFEWRPRPLKAATLPYWDGDFSRVLDALATRGFLVRYTCADREYGYVTNFRKHQFLNNKEPASRLPNPPNSESNSVRSRDADANGTRESHDGHAPIPMGTRSPPVPYPVPHASQPPDPDPTRTPAEEQAPGQDEPPDLPIVEPLTDAPTELNGSAVERKALEFITDPYRCTMAHGPPETWPEVVAANEAFRVVWPAAGRLRARDTRAVVIVERFAQGYTLDQLVEAARGARLDPHIAGNAAYQTVSTIWRDTGQVDKFSALLKAPPTNGADRDWPSVIDRELRDGIAAGLHGKILRTKLEAGQLDATLARRLIREREQQRQDVREREA